MVYGAISTCNINSNGKPRIPGAKPRIPRAFFMSVQPTAGDTSHGGS